MYRGNNHKHVTLLQGLTLRFQVRVFRWKLLVKKRDFWILFWAPSLRNLEAPGKVEPCVRHICIRFSVQIWYILFQTQIGTYPFHNDAKSVYTEVCHNGTDTVLNMY